MSGVPRRAVFLDRDGVLTRAVVHDGKPYPPATPEEVEILPGAAEACRKLRDAGFRLVMVTNQPDVARGTVRREAIEETNALLRERLGLDDVRVCCHDDADGCDCRKPKPGMLLTAAAEGGIDLAHSFMVGDRWRDVEAGRAAGCTTVFIDYGYSEPRPAEADHIVGSLLEASEWILRRHGP